MQIDSFLLDICMNIIVDCMYDTDKYIFLRTYNDIFVDLCRICKSCLVPSGLALNSVLIAFMFVSIQCSVNKFNFCVQ